MNENEKLLKEVIFLKRTSESHLQHIDRLENQINLMLEDLDAQSEQLKLYEDFFKSKGFSEVDFEEFKTEQLQKNAE